MTSAARIQFHDGHSIPQLGLGVWKASNEQAALAVKEAIQCGYRHIDTAAIYGNEEGVGEGIRQSGISREDLFLTTKVWNDAQGYDAAWEAIKQSLKKLGTDYVDLLLIHWPRPNKCLYVETWQALIEMQKQGLVKSIGVSNFTEGHLKHLVADTGVKPVINQIELHPYMQQQAMQQAHESMGVVTESWSPLAQNNALSDSVIETIAKKHGKTPAQIIIRWHIESGNVVIPKSVTPSRIKENGDVFNFSLDQDDITAIASLERGERLGPDPETFN
ncbi:aldo/keto reductase [Vibrio palustris]|uniref:Putative oxidoreductase/MSMEI_2347 n=1 Tax=Vibrio palustris TaxID=1918946 RepID=A0A1R4B6I2_9VIBR|nr:aldo/keto reductase [Vibrio palustris]SJL84496.1 putative oxidoreductase/MSMEI_2347 [Vibrio palustris]